MISKSINKFASNNYEFSINLSIEDLMNEKLISFLYDYSEQKDMFKRMVIEIVESEEIEDSDAVAKTIRKFKDRGVRGKSSSAKAPDSPYRFGTGSGKKGGLRKSMKDYVKRKGIQCRDKKTGRFLSYESTAYLISRSIYHKGTKASLFFTKPFEAAFKRLPDELLKAYSVGIEKQIQINLKEL